MRNCTLVCARAPGQPVLPWCWIRLGQCARTRGGFSVDRFEH